MKKTVAYMIGCMVSLSSMCQAYETIHFHFDKDVYLPGETIWYKAYLYNHTKPAATSTNLYCALYDAAGKLLQQKQYPIFEGVANGDFILPDTIGNGNLIFRAFTKTMQQQDSVNVYQQPIRVAGSNTAAALPLTKVAVSGLRFFPEGGHLLADVQNYLGISTHYTDGTPITAKGVIKKDNVALDSFETDANGMAVVQLMPEANGDYHAMWTDENGDVQKTKLPPIKEKGVALHTEMAGNKLFYMVSKNTTAPNFNTLHLVAQQGEDMVYEAKLLMPNTMQAVNQFSTDSLPSGLLLVTLYDSGWNQLAQRTLFVNSPAPPLKLNINMLTNNRAPKQKNVIEIAIPDTVKTNLSVAIVDAAFYKEGKPTLKEALLLGRSGSFPPIGDSAPTNLTDLFTLNHYWPMQATGNIVKAVAAIDNYLDLHFTSNKKLATNETLTVIIKDKLSGRQFVEIAPTGRAFAEDGLVFYDSAKIYYQLQKDKGMVDEIKPTTDSRVLIPTVIAPLNIFTKPSKKEMDAEKDSVFANFAKAKPGAFNRPQTLQEVTVKSRFTNPATKRQMEMEDSYATGPFKGQGRGFFLNVMDDPNAENVIDIYNYVAFRVPGLSIVYNGLEGKKLATTRELKNNEPLIFINEQESTNEVLQTIPISQIAYVKFIPGIVVLPSSQTLNGALYVYLKKGNEPLPPSKNMRTVFARGYNSTASFSQPDYEDKANLLTIDNRSTLYWNPYVITDAANPTFTIAYYNNDLSKKLILVIKGMDEKGRLVQVEKIIE